MINLPISDFDLAKQAEVNEQFLGVLRNNLLQLLKNVIQNELSGLLLELGQLGHSGCVEFDGREGKVDLILHLHAILHEKFLENADDGFLGVVLRDELGGELDCMREKVR